MEIQITAQGVTSLMAAPSSLKDMWIKLPRKAQILLAVLWRSNLRSFASVANACRATNGLIIVLSFAFASGGALAQTTTPQQRLQQSADDINLFLQQNGQGGRGLRGPRQTRCRLGRSPAVGSSNSDLSGPPSFNPLFQARNPRVCGKMTHVPNAAQAAVMVQCDREAASRLTSFTPILFLATDVQVEIGAPRNFIQSLDSWQDIDVKAKVYPLRGSATSWTCEYARDSLPYLNCNREGPSSKSVGECWHTNFGDWRCQMTVGGGASEMRVKGPTGY